MGVLPSTHMRRVSPEASTFSAPHEPPIIDWLNSSSLVILSSNRSGARCFGKPAFAGAWWRRFAEAMLLYSPDDTGKVEPYLEKPW